jgi:hypothetical protein
VLHRENTFFAITILIYQVFVLAITMRLFVHLKHAAIKVLKTSLVVSTDTDVVVLAISIFAKLEIDKLWIAFGEGKDLRWIPIHEISNALGPRALGLPFFHAFTGCDTVSTFHGKGKRTSW